MNNNLFPPVDIKVKLSTLWIFVMLNMIYADIIGNLEPGVLEAVIAGDFGFEMTPTMLIIISLIQVIPITMVLFSRLLRDDINRWANISAAVITLAYVTVGGSWESPSYIIFVTLEIVAMLTIIWSAWRWSVPVRSATPSLAKS